MAWAPPVRTEEIFLLYRRYLESRHPGGGMDMAAPADFDQFLACAWSPTQFLEFRRDGELLAIAATDVLPNALSAIYVNCYLYSALLNARRAKATLNCMDGVADCFIDGQQRIGRTLRKTYVPDSID